jgi:hypothetical protein
MATRATATRLFLGFTGLLFAGYGLVCLAAPETVANLTGLQLSTGTASVEVRAMYGGLQTAVGLLALLAVARESLRTPILLCIAVIFFGLVSGRLVGIAIDPDPGSYNFFAAGYEAASAAVAFALLPRRAAASSPA